MTVRAGFARLDPGAWWRQRSPREGALLLGLAFAVIVYGVVIGLVRPMLAAQAEATASIARSEAALSRLAAAPAPPAMRTVLGSDEPVASILTSTATEFGLTIRRIQSEAERALVTIEDAAYADVIRWISALELEYGMRLDALEMSRRPDPGRVSVSVTVRR